MEGARRIDEWGGLACCPTARSSSARSRSETEKITLSLDEWRILFLINGQRTLKSSASRRVEAFQVYRLVYGLLAYKLIEPAKDSGIDRDVVTGQCRRSRRSPSANRWTS
jgi:hypothetical protein